MPIESIMFFALGALAASLLALLIIPAIWRRAVRLTTRRIEAATPMSLAEFRADKDQLRAEFALSTRKLEMNVEALRKRLAEQVSDLNQKTIELSALKAERDQHVSVSGEVQQRDAELRARVLELEKENADVTQRLRMRDREFAAKVTELEALRDGAGTTPALPPGAHDDAGALRAALAQERQRASALEHQVRSLIGRMEEGDRRPTDSDEAAAELRFALAKKDKGKRNDGSALLNAEAKLASAEARLSALLKETEQLVDVEEDKAAVGPSEHRTGEDQLAALRDKVVAVEAMIREREDGQDIPQDEMREQLRNIASEVSRVVYALDADAAPESLFDRVQRFADDGVKVEAMPARASKPSRAKPAQRSAAVSDRLAALQDLQGRN